MIRVNLWDYEKFPADLKQRVDALVAAEKKIRVYDSRSGSLSRVLGGELRRRAGNGEFSRSTKEMPVALSLVEEDSRDGMKEQSLAKGTIVQGMFTHQMPPFSTIRGKTMRIAFQDRPDLYYPVEGSPRDLRAFSEELSSLCIANFHGIARETSR